MKRLMVTLVSVGTDGEPEFRAVSLDEVEAAELAAMVSKRDAIAGCDPSAWSIFQVVTFEAR